MLRICQRPLTSSEARIQLAWLDRLLRLSTLLLVMFLLVDLVALRFQDWVMAFLLSVGVITMLILRYLVGWEMDEIRDDFVDNERDLR